MPEIDLLEQVWFGATVLEWLIAAATLTGVYLGLAAIRHIAIKRLGAIAARSPNKFDDLTVDIIRRTRQYLLFLIAVHAAARVVPLPDSFDRVLRVVTILALLLQAGRWGNGVISFMVTHYSRQRGDDIGSTATIKAIGYAAMFGLWAILLITALGAFGINVTALVTGLGIGGIAIALAVQNILGDLFAALAIVVDKPFVVGEFIQTENVIGTVEHIGLKTTRIRSLSGEQIAVSNADLLKSRIRNYKRMHERRILFHLDVTYDTPAEKVERIPGMIREIIQARDITRFDRCHFLSYAESSLRIETVYFILDRDFNKYADVQHAVNLAILRRFAEEGIEFAFPTRTLYQVQAETTGT